MELVLDSNEKFPIIMADPPWNYVPKKGMKGAQRHVSNHYPTMPLSDLCALPVADVAADNAVLFIWTTGPFLQNTFQVIDAWGFTYKTFGFTWAKTNKKSPGFFTGMGYYTRANAELCLLATRGKVLKRKSAGVDQLIISPIRGHSRKPDEVYDRIEALYDGPYLELFARGNRPGWTLWGNEVGKF